MGGSDTRKRETCGLSSSPAMEEELPFAGCNIPETVSATASPETVEKELPDPTRQQAASFTLEPSVRTSPKPIAAQAIAAGPLVPSTIELETLATASSVLSSNDSAAKCQTVAALIHMAAPLSCSLSQWIGR